MTRTVAPVFVVVVGIAGLVTGAREARTAPARKPAAAPAPYFVKTAASLAEAEKALQGKGGKAADLLKPGATAVEIAWRHEEDFEQPELEVHDGKDHVFFVTEGQATLTLGGELVAPREISTGEWRAAKSANSKNVDVGKGDLVFIPHGTVHGRSVKGKKLTMMIVSFYPGGPPPAPAAPPTPAK
jgi:mannose-6-phosphate isomerase-like protein (cupin superfamily)